MENEGFTAEPIVTPSQAAPAPVAEPTPAAPAAATSEPAAAAAPVPGEGAAPAADPKPEFKQGSDYPQHLKDVLKWKEKHPEAVTAPVEDPKVETPAEEKTPEQIAAETKAAEEAAEKAKTEQKIETSPYDKSGPLPAEKLAAALAEDKALSTALEGKVIKLDDGREINLKDAIFESSRMAAQAQPILEIAPTLEAAQEMQQASGHFFNLDQKFPAIKDITSYAEFMRDTLLPLSLVLDDEGKPIPDPSNPGMFKNDGSIDRFVRFTGDVEFDQLTKIGQYLEKNSTTEEAKNYAKDIISAAEFLNGFRTNGYKMPVTPSGEKPTIPPEVQAELDRSRARDKELTERETAQKRQAAETFEEKVSDGTFEKVTPMIEDVIGKTSLSDYEKKKVAEEVWNDLTNTLSKHDGWQRGRENIMSRRELNDSIRDRRVAHNVSYMKSVLTGILDKRLQEAGAKRMEANKERDSKIATQIDKSKMEPRSSTTAGSRR